MVFIAFVASAAPPCLLSQSNPWTPGSGGTIYYNGGNIGIGTTTPNYSLEVNGEFQANGKFPLVIGTSGFAYIPANTSHIAYYRKRGPYEFYWRSSDNGQPGSGNESQMMSLNESRLFLNTSLGIGTSNPGAYKVMSISRAGNGVSNFVASTPGVSQGETSSYTLFSTFQGTNDNAPRRTADIIAGYNGAAWGNEYLSLNVGSSDNEFAMTSEKLRVLANGNVGIGTSAPQYRLSVNGTVQAKEVIVNSGWADYVFAPGHKLQPLVEVEKFITQNHHLPDIPSAVEVQENGVSVGSMQVKLLAKIEELTLHVIELEKKISDLEVR